MQKVNTINSNIIETFSSLRRLFDLPPPLTINNQLDISFILIIHPIFFIWMFFSNLYNTIFTFYNRSDYNRNSIINKTNLINHLKTDVSMG